MKSTGSLANLRILARLRSEIPNSMTGRSVAYRSKAQQGVQSWKQIIEIRCAIQETSKVLGCLSVL